MFAHKQIWRSFRPPVAFSDIETSKRRKTVCPKSHGFRVQASFFTPSLVILFYISSKLPFTFPLGKGSSLPFNLWILTSALCKTLLCLLLASAHGWPSFEGKRSTWLHKGTCHEVGMYEVLRQCQPAPFFSIPLLFGEKNIIRKQLETQTWCLVCAKLHGKLFEGKDFP